METENRSWKGAASAFRARGEMDKLVELLRQAADAGDAEAGIVLAKEYFGLRQFVNASDTLIRYEKQVSDDDAEAHWHIYLAYFLGIGEVDILEKWRRGVRHLEIAAELSRIPQLLMEVASYYENGLNGVPKDLALAENWLRKAAETGNDEAARRHRRVTSKLRKANRLGDGTRRGSEHAEV
jgi:TPR repeat protein